ncbi:MAG: hypothetical protein ACRDI1_07015 [Actinomycetota bacterium]
MSGRVAVLVWEENRPWVSALRQKGFSVPWVEEPKNDLHKQIPASEPDVLVVDLTRLPERGKDMVADLAGKGKLEGIPVILVTDKVSAARGLKGKVGTIEVVGPKRLVGAVRQVLEAKGAKT